MNVRVLKGSRLPNRLRRQLKRLTDIMAVGLDTLPYKERLDGGAGRVTKGRNGRVIYLDLGVHTEGKQLELVMRWLGGGDSFHAYGFEANPAHCEKAKSRFRDYQCVTIINAALVGPDHTSSDVDLYAAGPESSGQGDTLFPQRGSRRGYSAIKAPALRLSQFLEEAGVDLTRDVVLLRMNIEGSEVYVLEDLEAAGLLEHVDCFYGRWDDPSKIDPALGERLEVIMSRNKLHTIPFNDPHVSGRLGSLGIRMLRRHMRAYVPV